MLGYDLTPWPASAGRRDFVLTQDNIVPSDGVLLGRASIPGHAHPRVVTVRGDDVFDITSRVAPTVRDICEMGDPGGYVARAEGEYVGQLGALLDNSWAEKQQPGRPFLLSPIDLQAVKASGVTFVVSLLERVIEEQARGDNGQGRCAARRKSPI